MSSARFTTKFSTLKFPKLCFVTLLVTLQEQHTTLALSYPLNAYPAGFGTAKAPPLAPRLVGIRNDPAGLQQCFFWGGNGSICSCQCFQEPYLETGRGKVHFSQLFSKIEDRQNFDR